MTSIKEINQARVAILKAEKGDLKLAVSSNPENAHKLDLLTFKDDQSLSLEARMKIRVELASRGMPEYLPRIYACGYSVSHCGDYSGNSHPSGMDFRGWALRTAAGNPVKAGNHIIWFASSDVAQEFNLEMYEGKHFVDFLNYKIN